jgi:hypothetical protein
MINITRTLCSLVLLVCAPFALAQSSTGTGPNPYRDCGIGAALFPETHWAAVTSNVIWDVGTTAVISATSSPETCQGSQAKTAQFIFDTYDNIVEQTAQGSGKHLTAMLNILGCSAEQHAPIISQVRTGVAQQVASSTYANTALIQKASNYYDNLIEVSANTCS